MSRMTAEVPLSYSDLVPEGGEENENALFGDSIPIRTWSRGRGLSRNNSFDGSMISDGVVLGADGSIASIEEGSNIHNDSQNSQNTSFSAGDQSMLHYFASKNEGGGDNDSLGTAGDGADADGDTELPPTTKADTLSSNTKTKTKPNSSSNKVSAGNSLFEDSHWSNAKGSVVEEEVAVDEEGDNNHPLCKDGRGDFDDDAGMFDPDDGDDDDGSDDGAFGGFDFCVTGKSVVKPAKSATTIHPAGGGSKATAIAPPVAKKDDLKKGGDNISQPMATPKVTTLKNTNADESYDMDDFASPPGSTFIHDGQVIDRRDDKDGDDDEESITPTYLPIKQPYQQHKGDGNNDNNNDGDNDDNVDKQFDGILNDYSKVKMPIPEKKMTQKTVKSSTPRVNYAAKYGTEEDDDDDNEFGDYHHQPDSSRSSSRAAAATKLGNTANDHEVDNDDYEDDGDLNDINPKSTALGSELPGKKSKKYDNVKGTIDFKKTKVPRKPSKPTLSQFEANDKHRQWLAEQVEKKRKEEESITIELEKQIAKRKKFKEALLEKALKSRTEKDEQQEQAAPAVIIAQTKDNSTNSNDNSNIFQQQQLLVQQHSAQAAFVAGAARVPGLPPKVKPNSGRATSASASSQQQQQQLSSRQADITDLISDEEYLRLETEKREKIAEIRRRFKEKNRLILQKLTEKNQAKKEKQVEDQENEKKRVQKYKRKILEMVERRELLEKEAAVQDRDNDSIGELETLRMSIQASLLPNRSSNKNNNNSGSNGNDDDGAYDEEDDAICMDYEQLKHINNAMETLELEREIEELEVKKSFEKTIIKLIDDGDEDPSSFSSHFGVPAAMAAMRRFDDEKENENVNRNIVGDSESSEIDSVAAAAATMLITNQSDEANSSSSSRVLPPRALGLSMPAQSKTIVSGKGTKGGNASAAVVATISGGEDDGSGNARDATVGVADKKRRNRATSSSLDGTTTTITSNNISNKAKESVAGSALAAVRNKPNLPQSQSNANQEEDEEDDEAELIVQLSPEELADREAKKLRAKAQAERVAAMLQSLSSKKKLENDEKMKTEMRMKKRVALLSQRIVLEANERKIMSLEDNSRYNKMQMLQGATAIKDAPQGSSSFKGPSKVVNANSDKIKKLGDKPREEKVEKEKTEKIVVEPSSEPGGNNSNSSGLVLSKETQARLYNTVKIEKSSDAAAVKKEDKKTVVKVSADDADLIANRLSRPNNFFQRASSATNANDDGGDDGKPSQPVIMHDSSKYRDYADWKKKNNVRPDQPVFSMTGWYPCVKASLFERGWFYNPDINSPYSDFKWTLKSVDVAQDSLLPNQLTNHFLKNMAITTKSGLLKCLRTLNWVADESLTNIVPRGYDLSEPHELQGFIDDFRIQESSAIVKKLFFEITGCTSLSIEYQRKEVDLSSHYVPPKKGVKSTTTTKGGSGGDSNEDNVNIDMILSARDPLVEMISPKEDVDLNSFMVNEAVFDAACHILERYIRPFDDEDDSFLDDISNNNMEEGAEMVRPEEWEVIAAADIKSAGSLSFEAPDAVDGFLTDLIRTNQVVDDYNGPGSSNPSQQKSAAVIQKEQKQKQAKNKAARDKYSEMIKRMVPLGKGGYDRIFRILLKLETIVEKGQSGLNGKANVAKNLWIVKPAAKSRGRGICCFNDLGKLLKYVEAGNGLSTQWMVQKYMENPMVIANRKFDFRQWVLVTDWNPLTIYFYHKCYARFSVEEYSCANDQDIENVYAHLVNNSIGKDHPDFKECIATENGINIEGYMMDFDKFSEYLQFRTGSNVMLDKIQPRMKEITKWSLMCASENVEHRKNSFELYGFDFMVDEDYNTWLIEINSSPACDYSTKVTEVYIQKALPELLDVVLDVREWETDCRKQRASGTPQSSLPPKPNTGGWEQIYRGPLLEKSKIGNLGSDMAIKGEPLKRKVVQSFPLPVYGSNNNNSNNSSSNNNNNNNSSNNNCSSNRGEVGGDTSMGIGGVSIGGGAGGGAGGGRSYQQKAQPQPHAPTSVARSNRSPVRPQIRNNSNNSNSSNNNTNNSDGGDSDRDNDDSEDHHQLASSTTSSSFAINGSNLMGISKLVPTHNSNSNSTKLSAAANNNASGANNKSASISRVTVGQLTASTSNTNNTTTSSSSATPMNSYAIQGNKSSTVGNAKTASAIGSGNKRVDHSNTNTTNTTSNSSSSSSNKALTSAALASSVVASAGIAEVDMNASLNDDMDDGSEMGGGFGSMTDELSVDQDTHAETNTNIKLMSGVGGGVGLGLMIGGRQVGGGGGYNNNVGGNTGNAYSTAVANTTANNASISRSTIGGGINNNAPKTVGTAKAIPIKTFNPFEL